MLNYIWSTMILISLAVAAVNGRLDVTAAAAVEGAAAAVDTCFALLGIMCLWTGLVKIGERAGLIQGISKLLRPLLWWLFPKIKEDDAAQGSIVMNVAANLFGMGNAATPLGIKAMEDLNRANKRRSRASDAMCMFVVLNTASVQLVPTTLISLRQVYGSASPGEIIVPVWIVSICALFVGISAAKLFERRNRI